MTPAEIMVRTECEMMRRGYPELSTEDAKCEGPDCECWGDAMEFTRAQLTALEAAGLRIVGPEVYQSMADAGMDALELDRLPGAKLRIIWEAMHAAAPTYGDGK